MTAIATAAPASVQFTEEMLGHVTFDETDYNRGAVTDRPGASFLKFHLTIAVDDIARFGGDPLRQAGAFGWVESDALGGRLPVERGEFNLFVDVEPGVRRRQFHRLGRGGHDRQRDHDRGGGAGPEELPPAAPPGGCAFVVGHASEDGAGVRRVAASRARNSAETLKLLN
jgi:hypothetical protein